MRKIKFRAWDETNEKMWYWKEGYIHNDFWHDVRVCDHKTMQYTGLKDKNDLTEVYECDIIDIDGKVKGNIYEMDKEKTDLVIQGFGTKTWCKTYNDAILRGCKDSE